MIIPTLANAENWQIVDDTVSGSARLIINIDTLTLDEYDNGKNRIYSYFRIVTPDETLPQFAAVIDVDDCLKRQSGIMYYVFEDGTKKQYFWSHNGNKLYDSAGKYLCGYLVYSLFDKEKETNKGKYM